MTSMASCGRNVLRAATASSGNGNHKRMMTNLPSSVCAKLGYNFSPWSKSVDSEFSYSFRPLISRNCNRRMQCMKSCSRFLAIKTTENSMSCPSTTTNATSTSPSGVNIGHTNDTEACDDDKTKDDGNSTQLCWPGRSHLCDEVSSQYSFLY